MAAAARLKKRAAGSPTRALAADEKKPELVRAIKTEPAECNGGGGEAEL